jgi:glycosyltransferase involved in cell wall biosynthesis
MITIVLPVYNGGVFVRRCLESIARQDAPAGSFDLVILDNCSTDGSLDAVTSLPSGLSRHVLRAERHLSIEENWDRIRQLKPNNPYITIVGHDDEFDPEFIRVMSSALRDRPGTRLLLSHFRLIDQEGRRIRPCQPMGGWESAANFIAGRFARIRDSFGTGYVVAFEDYCAVGGIPTYPKLIYSDDALWVSLARRDGIRILEEECFSYRLHTTNTSKISDAGFVLRAFANYLEFLFQQSDQDPAIRSVMKRYGPSYVYSISTHWIWEEAKHANATGSPARREVVDGWRDLYRRFLALVGEEAQPEPEEIEMSLWANQGAVRRRLWASRPTRVIFRGVIKGIRTAANSALGRSEPRSARGS